MPYIPYRRYFISEAKESILQNLTTQNKKAIYIAAKSILPKMLDGTVSHKSGIDQMRKTLRDLKQSSDSEGRRVLTVFNFLYEQIRKMLDSNQIKHIPVADIESKILGNDPEWITKYEKLWINRGGDNVNDKNVDDRKYYLKTEETAHIDLSKLSDKQHDDIIELLNNNFPKENAKILAKDDPIAALGIDIYEILDEDNNTWMITLYPDKGTGLNIFKQKKLSDKLNPMKWIKTKDWTVAFSDNLKDWLNNGVVGRNSGSYKDMISVAYSNEKPMTILSKIADITKVNMPSATQIISKVTREVSKDKNYGI